MGVTKEQVEASLTSKLNPVHLVTQLILSVVHGHCVCPKVGNFLQLLSITHA